MIKFKSTSQEKSDILDHEEQALYLKMKTHNTKTTEKLRSLYP